MKKQVYYRYLGTNGIIETPIHLEDTYYTRLIHLTAEDNCILTNGKRKVYNIYYLIEAPASFFLFFNI